MATANDETPGWVGCRAEEQAARANAARAALAASGRRRLVDPTTCEREYTEAETEFMMAMDDYKRRSGRAFPTWSEVLEVLRGLGYEKAGADRGQPPGLARPTRGFGRRPVKAPGRRSPGASPSR